MNAINLALDYAHSNGDILFNLKFEDDVVGELELMHFDDSYTTTIRSDIIFSDEVIDNVFEQLYKFIDYNVDVLLKNKPFYLLDIDDNSVNYANYKNLRKVPRYCGYYLYNC